MEFLAVFKKPVNIGVGGNCDKFVFSGVMAQYIKRIYAYSAG